MKINKGYIAVGLIIAFSLFFALAAHADEYDETTTITFNQSVQIPGRVLPAGSYVFQLVDTESDRHIVQVCKSLRTVVYATLHAIPADRRYYSADGVVT